MKACQECKEGTKYCNECHFFGDRPNHKFCKHTGNTLHTILCSDLVVIPGNCEYEGPVDEMTDPKVPETYKQIGFTQIARLEAMIEGILNPLVNWKPDYKDMCKEVIQKMKDAAGALQVEMNILKGPVIE